MINVVMSAAGALTTQRKFGARAIIRARLAAGWTMHDAYAAPGRHVVCTTCWHVLQADERKGPTDRTP